MERISTILMPDGIGIEPRRAFDATAAHIRHLDHLNAARLATDAEVNSAEVAKRGETGSPYGMEFELLLNLINA